jgi:rSAM/selenodomain-associated transferase 1
MSRQIIVFAKEPEPGRVKTRLTPPLVSEAAVGLYKAFVTDVLAQVCAVGPEVRKTLCVAGEPGDFLQRCAGDSFDIQVQQGAELGARMAHALAGALRESDSVVLVGTDAPSLPPALLGEAFERLEAGSELVLGPAIDGGYYLVGVREQVPDVFAAITWSSSQVMTQTLLRARKARTQVALLPFWYDVDTVEDLRWLALHLLQQKDQDELLATETIGALEALNRTTTLGLFPWT